MRLTFQGRRALVLGGSCTIGLILIDLLLESGLTIVPTHSSDIGRAALAERFPDLAASSL